MRENFEKLVDHLMDSGFFLEQAVELIEKTMIERALQRTGGNRCAASKLLGIHRNTLGKKIEQFGIKPKRTARKPMARAAVAGAARARHTA